LYLGIPASIASSTFKLIVRVGDDALC